MNKGILRIVESGFPDSTFLFLRNRTAKQMSRLDFERGNDMVFP